MIQMQSQRVAELRCVSGAVSSASEDVRRRRTSTERRLSVDWALGTGSHHSSALLDAPVTRTGVPARFLIGSMNLHDTYSQFGFTLTNKFHDLNQFDFMWFIRIYSSHVAAAFCVSQGVGALDPNGKLQRKPHVEASSRSSCDSCAPQAAFERLDGSNAHEYSVVVRGGTMISYVVIQRSQYCNVLHTIRWVQGVRACVCCCQRSYTEAGSGVAHWQSAPWPQWSRSTNNVTRWQDVTGIYKTCSAYGSFDRFFFKVLQHLREIVLQSGSQAEFTPGGPWEQCHGVERAKSVTAYAWSSYSANRRSCLAFVCATSNGLLAYMLTQVDKW